MSDLISRQAAEAIFRNAKKSLYEQSLKGKIEYKEFQIREMMLLNAEQFIHLLPSVEPERKMGKWISEQPWCLPKCSICGASSFGQHGFDAIKTPYCPNCGAKMEVNT